MLGCTCYSWYEPWRRWIAFRGMPLLLIEAVSRWLGKLYLLARYVIMTSGTYTAASTEACTEPTSSTLGSS